MKQLPYQILLLPENTKYELKATTLEAVGGVVERWMAKGIVKPHQVALYARNITGPTRIGFRFDDRNDDAKAIVKQIKQLTKQKRK